ncbi:mitochondrial ribosomal death-associated protein 3-domain-containing protein [Boletus coccyginus]|nr:mitochondrial ribosomal death-associated protein 3-domain-containing protein [Boletus coccyginus]
MPMTLQVNSRTMATLTRRAPRALLQTSPTQLRNYASPSGFKRKTGIRDGDGAPDALGEQPTGRRRRDTAFLPMPTSQLTHPLFQPDHLSRLTLQSFHPETITPAVVSQALKFPHNEKDPFRIFGLPRNLLVEFRILSAPCSVVRDVTIDVVNRLDIANQASSVNHRLVFTGATGCGKSVLLLQALQYCHTREWIVFYFPRSINLVNSTMTYAYDPRTRLYQQATIAYQTLQRFLTVNSYRLDQLKTTVGVELERRGTIPAGTVVSDLVRAGIKERALAPTVLTALMEELQKQTEFPVLLAIDDFQAIYCKTKYRDPHFSTIKPYHLSMPRLLLEFASGQRQFARGAVIGALSTTNVEFRPPLELTEALGIPPVLYDGPHVKRSSMLQTYAKGLERVAVPDALTVQEAMEVFDLWSKDNAIPSAPTDELFLSKYSESYGNAREFVWKGLLASLST